MKIAFLLAGVGKRMGALTIDSHKSMIKLDGRPLLGQLVERFLFNDQHEYVLAVGHCKDQILDYLHKTFAQRIRVTAVENPKYQEYNNLYSLWLLREELAGQEFILCNGDLVLNKIIIRDLLEHEGQSAIVLDDTRDEPIDSPGTIVREGRIYDLGRHIPFEQNGGYAIGLYKFNAELSDAFFLEADKILQAGQFQAGFHDPLPRLFASYPVAPLSTGGFSWTDIDLPEEITTAECVLRRIQEEEKAQRQGARTP